MGLCLACPRKQSTCPDRGLTGNVRSVSAPGESVSPIESSRAQAAMLAGIGGFVDAAGFLAILGLFTAHMSGNTTGLGVALATEHWDEALRRGVVIPIYILATVAGVAWIEAASLEGHPPNLRNRAIAGVLGAEVVMLAVFMIAAGRIGEPVALDSHRTGFFVTASAATLAMGFQNAALRRTPDTAVHTTFVTGMLTELSVAVVRWILNAQRGRESEAIRSRQIASVALIIWSAYLLGAITGAWLVSRHGIWTLSLPIALLLSLIPSLLRPAAPSPR